MSDTSRTTLLAAVVGLILLGAVFAFTVGLPELGDDPEQQEETAAAEVEPIELPDELDGGLVAVDTGNLPPELTASFGDAEALQKQEASVGETLESLFDTPGAFRLYAAADGSALVTVTVLDAPPGLFAPDAPPIAADLLGVERPSVELVDIDGAVCSVNWGQEVPEGQPVDAAQVPQIVRCQLGAGERTFEISAQGMPSEQAVALLKGLAA